MKRGMQQVFKVAGLGGVSIAMALGMALASPAALAKQVIRISTPAVPADWLQ